MAQPAIEGKQPYVYLDSIVLEGSWTGEVRNMSLLVVIAVNTEGDPEDSRHLRAGQGGQGWLKRVPQAFRGA